MLKLRPTHYFPMPEFELVLAATLLTLTLASTGQAIDHFVAPNGSFSGNGTFNSPWDLQTALNQPAGVLPGDTIWLRGGVYHAPTSNGFTSYLAGTAAGPILVRNYNGERA